MTNMPPQWAESVLQLLLEPEDYQTVSGDLLEKYREDVVPARGQSAADRWYVKQIAGFAWRDLRLWAALFSGAFIARTAVDWFVPTTEFYTRSTVSTAVAATILLAVGFRAAWRSDSIQSGAFAGVGTTILAALINALGTAALLALWHDPATLAAIQGSGGLAEVFTLPWTLIIPGAVLGLVGGLFGGAARKLVLTS